MLCFHLPFDLVFLHLSIAAAYSICPIHLPFSIEEAKKRHSTQSESKSKTVYFSCCFFFHCLFTRRCMLLIHAVIELIVMQFYACETIELAISWRNMIGDHLAGEHQHTPNKCKIIKFVRKCGLFSVFGGNERKKNQIFFFCPLDIN